MKIPLYENLPYQKRLYLLMAIQQTEFLKSVFRVDRNKLVNNDDDE